MIIQLYIQFLCKINPIFGVLEKGGFLSADDGKSCREEFTSFVVDIRARRADSGRSAEEIPDVVAYLLYDYSFLARKHL